MRHWFTLLLMIPGYFIVTYSLSYLQVVESTLIWYAVF
jgi:hypothetical protein